MDDAELEQAVRDGLRKRAAAADVSAAEDLLPTEPVRRPWLTPLLAAAAAVVVLVGGAVAAPLVFDGDDADRLADSGPVVTPTEDDLLFTPRTEHWGGLAVDVPADWGYGGAPLGSEPDPVACWPAAMVTADGAKLPEEDLTMGWVGRPIALTDLCQAYPDNHPDAEAPEAPYVWLGATVEPGTVGLGDGFVQETVVVAGETLTVGSDDDQLRRAILDTARPAELCQSELDPSEPLGVEPAASAGAEPTVMKVCAYRRLDDRSSTPRLSTAMTLGAGPTAAYVAALEQRTTPKDQCPTAFVEHEWVMLELLDEAGAVVRRDVIHLASRCAGVDVDTTTLDNYETSELTPEMVRPWAVGSIPATVYGPSGGKGAMLDSFIGPQG